MMMSLFCAEVRGEIIGPPILDNNYNLDLRQGPILGSARQVALGGAYIGVAEGITSLNSNPAGAAFRLERSTTRFDWDWTAGLNDLKSQDFDNNGQSPPDYKDHHIRSLGLMGQYGPWGVGVLTNAEILALSGPDSKQNEYVLSVTDSGGGIPTDLQPRIFERFFRADKARSRSDNDGGGAGLGLSISRWIAEAHHGRLELTRSDSIGSTFTAYLPAGPLPPATSG